MNPNPSTSQMTQFLRDLVNGVEGAHAEIMPHVYEQLRRIAGAQMRRQSAGHSLQPTGLVNEAFLRLIDQESTSVKDRAHFFALAARMMRQILVDHARRRAVRGARNNPILLDGIAMGSEADVDAIDLIELDSALKELAGLDQRECEVVELKFFGGLTIAEVAQVLGVSTPTVERDWAMARAWLGKRLGCGPDGASQS